MPLSLKAVMRYVVYLCIFLMISGSYLWIIRQVEENLIATIDESKPLFFIFVLIYLGIVIPLNFVVMKRINDSWKD